MLTPLLIACAFAACGGGSPTGTATASPRIASVIVVPGVASLGPTQSLQFTADVRDADGRPVSAPITWQATGGNINGTGLYVAGSQDGEYEVRAMSIGQVIGLAKIRIDSLLSRNPGNPDAPGGGDGGQGAQAATLTISPTSVTLETGASTQFSVDLRDSEGRALSDPVTWTATGGSVTSTGFFAAGTTPGSFQVTASAAGLTATASATVQARPGDVYLVVGNGSALNGSERVIRDRLATRVGAVTVLDDDALTATATSGCRLIVMSKTIQSETVGSKLKGASCGVVFWEDNQQMLSMMATVPNNGSGGTNWQSSGETVYVRTDVPSELRAGLAGGVRLYSGSAEITHSPSGDALPSGAVVIAEMYQGSSRKAIYVYEKGSRLADGTSAAGRRTYFGIYDDTFGQLSSEGLRLFDAAVDWTSGKIATSPSPQSPSATPPPAPAPPPTDPTPSGVAVQPGESIQAAVNANPSGTTFVIKAGVHRRQRIEPKDNTTFVGESGAVLDGENSTDFAFLGTARGVTIRNLVIERYVPGVQMGAIKAGDHDASRNSDGWLVEDNEIRYNDGGGVRIGHRMVLRDNYIHHNEQIGVVGVGDDVLVEGNEISYNNFNRKHDYGWEAGGTKFVKTRNLVVRNNHVHNNWGPGLWTDIDNIDTLYEGNLVEDNADTGIFHEISYRATIRNNTVRRNGYDRVGAWAYGAGILIAHSPDVEVHDNVVEDNQNGIMGVQQNRGSGAYGAHELRNLNVHDNTVVQKSKQWAAGVAQDVGDSGVFGRNIVFSANRYTLGSTSGRWFEWENGQRTTDQWKAYGHDTGGSFSF
ncbi:MAG TPA: right-handed parallel beta-helix repeat-containing protein [Gemmatimonadota bacterium]|nr:right-handed parallel beta-helix repeat-containing protein [Gemmatimonadota bacterium]